MFFLMGCRFSARPIDHGVSRPAIWRRRTNPDPKRIERSPIMKLQPYLVFNGRTEEALTFYQKAIGAEVLMMMRFKESPDPIPADKVRPGSEEKIMHACARIGDTEVMMSDGGCTEQSGFAGFSLSLSVPDEAAAKRAFTALSEGGQVHMPLGKTFWSPCFGMLADRFGVGWMVNVAEEGA
jgi:PhnB protein